VSDVLCTNKDRHLFCAYLATLLENPPRISAATHSKIARIDFSNSNHLVSFSRSGQQGQRQAKSFVFCSLTKTLLVVSAAAAASLLKRISTLYPIGFVGVMVCKVSDGGDNVLQEAKFSGCKSLAFRESRPYVGAGCRCPADEWDCQVQFC
jgi:hypothetical protein